MEFEEILSEIGENGRYQQLLMWFVLIPCLGVGAFTAYNQVFMAMDTDHFCQLTSEFRNTTKKLNLSINLVKKIGIPLIEGSNEYRKCHRYEFDELTTLERLVENSTLYSSDLIDSEFLQKTHEEASIVACDHGWYHHQELFSSSAVADFDLVCDASFGPTLALIVFATSGLIGNFIFGYLIDGIGRRYAFFLCLFISCVFGVASSFAPSFIWWLVLRAGVGFTIPAIMDMPFILVLELCGSVHRTTTNLLINGGYTASMIVLAVVVYFVRDWRKLSLATSVPFLGFFLYWWVFPESPRWLLARGRTREACKTIRTMARLNKSPVGNLSVEEIQARYFPKNENEDHDAGKKKKSSETFYGIRDLLRTPNLRKKTLIITFMWFVNNSVYVGLSYYAPEIGGDAYLNFFYGTLAELPTYLFLWPTMKFWGRRWILASSMVIGGLAGIVTLLSDTQTITLVLYCIGKFSIAVSFTVLALASTELYPTVVRGLGIGFSSTVAMIGPIVIPVVNHLGKQMMVLPLVIMGGFCVLGGLLALLLPETLHQPLPETLEDGETFGKNMSWADFFQCCPRRKLQEADLNSVEPECAPLKEAPSEDYIATLFASLENGEDYPESRLRRKSFIAALRESVV